MAPRCLCDPPTNRGSEFNEWIGYFFSQCVYNTSDYIGFILGLLNLAIWLYIYFPQIIQNYRTRGKGLNPTMIGMWLCGDVAGMIGLLMTGQTGLMLLTQFYYSSMDSIMLLQWTWYNVISVQKETQHDEANGLASHPNGGYVRQIQDSDEQYDVQSLESQESQREQGAANEINGNQKYTYSPQFDSSPASGQVLTASHMEMTTMTASDNQLTASYLDKNEQNLFQNPQSFQNQNTHFCYNDDDEKSHPQSGIDSQWYLDNSSSSNRSGNTKRLRSQSDENKTNGNTDGNNCEDEKSQNEPPTNATLALNISNSGNHNLFTSVSNNFSQAKTPRSEPSHPDTSNDGNNRVGGKSNSSRLLLAPNNLIVILACLITLTLNHTNATDPLVENIIPYSDNGSRPSQSLLNDLKNIIDSSSSTSPSSLPTHPIFSTFQATDTTIPSCSGPVATGSKRVVGIFFAFLCFFIYAPSRLPQAIYNYKRKSTYGLSNQFIALSFVAMGCWIGSILIPSSRYDFTNGYRSSAFWLQTFPYLASTLCALLINLAMIVQMWLYRERTRAEAEGIDIDQDGVVKVGDVEVNSQQQQQDSHEYDTGINSTAPQCALGKEVIIMGRSTSRMDFMRSDSMI